MADFKVIAINRHRMNIDGNGVTSLVSLEGCPLKCKYCINKDVLNKEYGKNYTISELWEKLSIDYCYFIGTGGGVTFGGGESLLWADKILQFARFVPEGVRVNLETSLNISFEDDKLFFEVLNEASELIIDVKTLNSSKYEQYTGISNSYVTENLNKIVATNLQNKCHIKIPVIPGLTTAEDAKKDELTIRNMGFSNVTIFDYVIRDYM